jgi:hypothetical protein
MESQVGSPTNPLLTGDKLSGCGRHCCCRASEPASLPRYLITCSKHKHDGQTHLNVTGPVGATPAWPAGTTVLSWPRGLTTTFRVQVLQPKQLHRRARTQQLTANKDQVNEAMSGTAGQAAKLLVLTARSQWQVMIERSNAVVTATMHMCNI